MQESNRILLATTLCVIIIIVFNYFFPQKYINNINNKKDISSTKNYIIPIEKPSIIDTKNDYTEKKVKIESKKFSGSINLRGALIDEFVLNEYKKNTDINSQKMDLLRNYKSKRPYYISFNIKINKLYNNIDIPGKNSLWESDNNVLSNENPVTLTWINDQKIKFKIVLKIVDDYLLRVQYLIENMSNVEPEFMEYINITKTKVDEDKGKKIAVHEGGLVVQNEKISEINFNKLEDKEFIYKSNINWAGFSDKYWLSAIISTKDEKINTVKFTNSNDTSDKDNHYFFLGTGSKQKKALTQKTTLLSDNYIFIGPKVIKILDDYSNKYNISLFDHAVDFGYLYFITKPLLILLVYFYELFKNFGIAILILTILVKIALFPLNYKGLKNMEKLKELNPKIQSIKQNYAGKNDLIQKHTIALYKKENVNPASGCIPIFIQMPIFYALYKVFCVSIEMRHAPILGWIKDLSSPDPLTIFNLFGLIKWTPPHYLMTGPIAITMAITMYIHQQMSPKPADQTQAYMMKFMPLFVMIMVSSFPAGLLIYWTWSNILSIIQQIITKKFITKNKTKNKIIQQITTKQIITKSKTKNKK
ncbi:membrane protein insertase YidC [Lyticum sinuosum]|uniref:Membrane protein insertase YidC n=1 Tax=Lyticum sinuosum TaxID=1332059 RepID=A0AAE5AGN4_9RICK|nr:membrane protein insertase YidC [Lyticum sinuosum]MDZ5760952.1 Membrane protein insertase YidC [Lyticum sinuosum]